MIIASDQEKIILKQSGTILAKVLNQVADAVKSGITTNDLNKLARELIFSYGAKPCFEGYKDNTESTPYPAALCTSVNEEVVHATPSNRVLKNGDIIGLDLGVVFKGFLTDMAMTVGVGKISRQAQKLIRITKNALEIGIAQVKPGNYTGDIGAAIASCVESNGFSVVRQLVGHGVGRAVHEDPRVPNFGKPKTGAILKQGMVIAIEPMVNVGNYKVAQSKDGFGFKTVDNKLSAHFEHTVMVTDKGCEIITKP